MAARSDISLDVESVIAAAFKVQRRVGIDRLTMRRLADELSVKPSAFYWHFRDKRQLLALMGQAIYEQAVAGTPTARDWRQWLIKFGLGLHRCLLARRDSARLFALASPKGIAKARARSRALAAPLLAFGIQERFALTCLSSVICLAVGWSTFNDNPPMHDMLGEMVDFEQCFDQGLKALVAGFPNDFNAP